MVFIYKHLIWEDLVTFYYFSEFKPSPTFVLTRETIIYYWT